MYQSLFDSWFVTDVGHFLLSRSIKEIQWCFLFGPFLLFDWRKKNYYFVELIMSFFGNKITLFCVIAWKEFSVALVVMCCEPCATLNIMHVLCPAMGN